VLTLDDHLYIGNLRKHGSEAMGNGDENMKKTMLQFFRKLPYYPFLSALIICHK
jgi:hypothetical protein